MSQPSCWKVDDNNEGNKVTKSDRHHNFCHELWTEMYKSKSTGSKAVYIDLEEDDENVDREYSKWSDLPDLLLETIFSYLTIRERYYASLVCRNWYRAFHFPYVWSRFVLEDNTLTRSRFNFYTGWQYVLDHLRAQMCLSSVGRNFKKLTINPMLNFYNLYEFMNMVSWYTEQSKAADNVELGIGKNINTLKFTFPCNMATRDDTERIRLFGTGGKLLASLKRLMGNLPKLQRLELIDLMLDAQEAQFLLDEVCKNTCETMRTLYIINATRIQYQVLHVGVFLNLQDLYISPQNLGDDTVELISQTNLKHLHIVQNRYSPTMNDVVIVPVSSTVWRNCRKNNPKLKVHLQVESVKEKWLIWQESAPVRSVLYDSPHIGLHTEDVDKCIQFYANDLRVYGHRNIPRFHCAKKFHDRNDGNLLMLARQCPYLTALVVTERVSTATVLLIAYTAKNLTKLIVRGNAVIIRCDWPRHPEWTDEFYSWLKLNSKSYEATEKEVTQIMGYRWKFLSDKEFKKSHINVQSI